MSEIHQILETFVKRWLEHQRANGINLDIDYDTQWPSPCYIGSDRLADGDPCSWQPVAQDSHTMFERLGTALETQIHPDIVAYYSCFWSEHLRATCNNGELELLQLWNEEDLERLRSNLVGHAMSKQKQRQPLSLFFALTLPDEGMLCIDNDSGEVWYELPGKKPIRKIADSLSDFLKTLSPADHQS
ncbi:MAG: SecY-interacting protein [Pseudomonadales bacterium]